MSVLLETHDLQAGYGRKQVVFDLNLKVNRGEIVAIFGHNGSGKSTSMRSILGVLPVLGGTITYDGQDTTNNSSGSNVRRGMALIPSERFVFQDLSVTDNLLLGGANDPDETRRKARQQLVYELFPILKEREEQLAGTMSGGQQRMVSLGIALMSNPKLLILDEPSLGLAPSVVEQIFNVVRDLVASEGLSVILLEQNVGQALKIADRGYVMRSGRIIIEETIEQMKARDSFWDFF